MTLFFQRVVESRQLHTHIILPKHTLSFILVWYEWISLFMHHPSKHKKSKRTWWLYLRTIDKRSLKRKQWFVLKTKLNYTSINKVTPHFVTHFQLLIRRRFLCKYGNQRNHLILFYDLYRLLSKFPKICTNPCHLRMQNMRIKLILLLKTNLKVTVQDRRKLVFNWPQTKYLLFFYKKRTI